MASRAHTILIVDDTMEHRETLRETIEEFGYPFAIHEAVDGQMARELLLEINFDLVLTDTNMPNACGIELLKWCRAHHPHIPVIIFFSGSFRFPEVSESDLLKVGAQSVLAKPYRYLDVKIQVKKALKLDSCQD